MFSHSHELSLVQLELEARCKPFNVVQTFLNELYLECRLVTDPPQLHMSGLQDWKKL
jgi:hypothetical protein